jgi:miniconductance mechanosensitive channel
MIEVICNFLTARGIDQEAAGLLARISLTVLALVLSIAANFVAKRFILKGLTHLIVRTGTTWDDIFLERKVFDKLSHLAPAAVLYVMLPLALEGYDRLIALAVNSVFIYMIIIGVLVIDSLLNAVLDLYRTLAISKEVPIKSFIQVVKVAIYCIVGIFIFSIVFDKTPLYFFSGLGALTAVLLLIFKDAILGFVAGIQLAANKMVAHGDWIEMPKYGADGDVLEVALTTVKVQNWDKTITTIPTYALISESFKNWRGMQQSGGRRIKRSVYIDINTITFCTDEMIERFSKIRYIADYMEKKKKELAEHNTAQGLDDAPPTSKRQLTNVGTFRAYVISYLKNHPMVNQDMTFLIRQLAPGEHGLPIEIYVFCKDKVWAHYEAIQSDIFDHILAVVPEFDLKVFQSPAGTDFKEFSHKRTA